MTKYDIKFCNCGRMHFVEWDLLYEAFELGKEILLICNNCGKSRSLG